MVSEAAQKVISTEYGMYATKQDAAANKWSWSAVVTAAAGVVVAVVVILSGHDLTVTDSIARTAISVAVLGVAGFMARESSGHRREARDAKRTQLDINTMRPFLATLPEEQQIELQRQLALRVFNRPLANEGQHTSMSPFSGKLDEAPSSDAAPPRA